MRWVHVLFSILALASASSNRKKSRTQILNQETTSLTNITSDADHIDQPIMAIAGSSPTDALGAEHDFATALFSDNPRRMRKCLRGFVSRKLTKGTMIWLVATMMSQAQIEDGRFSMKPFDENVDREKVLQYICEINFCIFILRCIYTPLGSRMLHSRSILNVLINVMFGLDAHPFYLLLASWPGLMDQSRIFVTICIVYLIYASIMEALTGFLAFNRVNRPIFDSIN